MDCCAELIKSGYSVTLNITGLKELPQECMNKPFIRNYGFLNKNKPNEYQKLLSIMGEQDIFLFPSKAECSSIALCEANGFGLPCFVYDTGGTENYVINGKNGYMLSLSCSGEDFARRIMACINSQELDELSKGAVKQYTERLNWEVWGEKFKRQIGNLS